ncbi:hypothetical protein GJ496_007932 [Pomphorhynchus laevis]|nr:hypothetical protein GJ496_007932 [Pomphorhynchus laevis]
MLRVNGLTEIHDALFHPGVRRLTHYVRSQNLLYSIDDIRRICENCEACSRNSKYDDIADQAKLVNFNNKYAVVEYPSQRQSYVSSRDVAPGCEVKGQESDAAEATKSTANENGADVLEDNLIDAEREEKEETVCEGDVAEEAQNVTKISLRKKTTPRYLNDSLWQGRMSL